jgi:hypothetical protein
LLDFKQNRNNTTKFSKNVKYEILRKSVQWSHAVPCGWKEGYDEAKSQFQQAHYSPQRGIGNVTDATGTVVLSTYGATFTDWLPVCIKTANT